MNSDTPSSDESKTVSDRIKEIATASTRVMLIACAALLLIWATKLEPSFYPILRYEEAAKRTKVAAKVHRHELHVLSKKFPKYDSQSPWSLETEARRDSKTNEPQYRWVIRENKNTEPPTPPVALRETEAPPATEAKPAVAAQPTPEPQSDEEPTPDPRAPTSSDYTRLERLNNALLVGRATGLDSEARKLGAASVEFELLSYKFPASVLYAPMIWNLFFLGLLVYAFFSRLKLFRLVIRVAELGTSERLYHVPWWAAPVPYIENRNLFEKVRRLLGWGEGTKGPIVAVALLLILAALLQGRVAQLGLAITETLGSGRAASLLKLCYYLVFGVFFCVVMIWLIGTIFRSEKSA